MATKKHFRFGVTAERTLISSYKSNVLPYTWYDIQRRRRHQH